MSEDRFGPWEKLVSSPAVATYRSNDPPMTSEPMRPVAGTGRLFATDTPGDDHADRAPSARLLADLAAHPEAGTPFLIAIHGSSGSGKSSLLHQIGRRLRQGGEASGAKTLPVLIDAPNDGETAVAIVAGILGALKPAYPALAEEARHAGGDPLKAARAASDRVGDLRRQLDAERQVLDELGGRQARLVDTILFNSPGSRVDAYARSNRGRIESRLKAFGLPAADPVGTYKDLVREASESAGGASWSGLALRALWGYKGQGTLIVLAILLLLIGWASTYFSENQDVWVNWLNGLGERFAGLSSWVQDHAYWLMPISHAAYALAALAVLVAIIRAFRFIQPVMRGASLLNGDIEERRRDVDSLLAHQTRRVDHLAAEVDGAVRSAESAERRVERRRAAGLLEPIVSGEGTLGVPASSTASAEAFLAGLGAAMTSGVPDGGAAAPSRIVVLFDELDRLTPNAAAQALDAAQKLLARPGFVTFAAVDRKHVLDGFSETDPAYAAGRLGRCVQLSYDLDAEVAATLNLGDSLAAADARAPALDRPLQDYEIQLLRELEVFAGSTPRAGKRFANAYRVARADPRMTEASPAEEAGLAIALALDERAAAAELGGYEDGSVAIDTSAPRSDLDYAVGAAHAAIGQPFSPVEARRGLRVARIYSRRG